MSPEKKGEKPLHPEIIETLEFSYESREFVGIIMMLSSLRQQAFSLDGEGHECIKCAQKTSVSYQWRQLYDIEEENWVQLCPECYQHLYKENQDLKKESE
jgi:hypothetical protein